MNRFLKIYTVVAVCVFLSVCLGCSEDKSTNPQESDLTVVTGQVAFIYDNVAADGGVTIDLILDNGKTDRLLFAPFYWGDDSEERWQLYSQIQEVEIGDRIRAKGRRTDKGVEIETLTILGR